MVRDFDNHRGQSLLETIMVIGLMSTILSVLIPLYVYGSTTFRRLLDQTDTQYSARSALQIMGEDIRGAIGIELLMDNTQLRLTSQDGNIIRYYRFNDQLFVETINNNGTVRIPVSENISSLSFFADNHLLSVDLTATKPLATFELSTCYYLMLAADG